MGKSFSEFLEIETTPALVGNLMELIKEKGECPKHLLLDFCTSEKITKEEGEGIITNLEMQLYLCVCDFKYNQKEFGQEGPVAVYTTPEQLWGRDYVESAYKEDPQESLKRLLSHLSKMYPGVDERIIHKVLCIKDNMKV